MPAVQCYSAPHVVRRQLPPALFTCEQFDDGAWSNVSRPAAGGPVYSARAPAWVALSVASSACSVACGSK